MKLKLLKLIELFFSKKKNFTCELSQFFFMTFHAILLLIFKILIYPFNLIMNLKNKNFQEKNLFK